MKKPAAKSKSIRPDAIAALLPERMAGEPERHYQRFLTYCLASGMHRSIEALWRAEQGQAGKSKPGGKSDEKQPPKSGGGAPGSWYKAAQDWHWIARCEVWDRDVTAAEAAELLAARKTARASRAALVEKLVAAASKLLDDPLILATMPAGTSAAVLRAVEASRRELGADLFPEEEAKLAKLAGGFPVKTLPPPIVEVYYDLGDGTRGNMRELPPVDVHSPDPTFDAPDDDEKSAAALPDGMVPVAENNPV